MDRRGGHEQPAGPPLPAQEQRTGGPSPVQHVAAARERPGGGRDTAHAGGDKARDDRVAVGPPHGDCAVTAACASCPGAPAQAPIVTANAPIVTSRTPRRTARAPRWVHANQSRPATNSADATKKFSRSPRM